MKILLANHDYVVGLRIFDSTKTTTEKKTGTEKESV